MAGMGLPGLIAAVQFLTRVPVRGRHAPDVAAATPWFPVAGALIGAFVGGVAVGLGEVAPRSVAAAVAVLAGVLVTGAFHEDGLADTADALPGGWTVERRLEILDDPRHGSYGVAALCGSIVLRVVSVAALGPAAAFAGLVAAHALGRGAAVGVMGAAPVARPNGLGADYARSVSGQRAAVGAIVAVAIAVIATGWWSAILAVTGAVAALVVTWMAIRAIGGVTGDVLGAIEQAAECTVLVAVAALSQHHQVWWT
jgi:adenosylcobinamide-GDP ribazoletransferase